MFKNLKNVKVSVSFVLAVALLVPLMSGMVFASANASAEAVDYSALLNRLGISAVGDSEAHITRGDFTDGTFLACTFF